MRRRPAHAGSADLLYKAEIPIRKKATSQRHPEIVDEPERRAILVRKYIWGNCFVHVFISFSSETGVRRAAIVADLLPILANLNSACERRQ